MTDLERKLEEIARQIWSKRPPIITLCPADAAIKDAERMGEILELVQAASQATARYCAEIVNKTTEAIAKAKNEEGNTEAGRALQKAVWATFTCEQLILRECGVKE